MATFESHGVEPDAGEQIEVLIEPNPLADGFEEFRGDIEGGFFAGLERRNGGASAAGGAVVAGFGESGEERHGGG